MATVSRGLRSQRCVCLVWLAVVVMPVTVRSVIAADPFKKYDLAMYDRPGFPSLGVNEVFTEGLVPLWSKALERRDTELRRMVIDTLAIARNMGHEEVLDLKPILVERLLDPSEDADVVTAAAAALVAFDAKDQADELAKAALQRGQAMSEIVEPALARWQSPALSDAWLDRISTADATDAMLILAMQGLAAIDHKNAKEPLLAIVLMTHQPADVRMNAARALATIDKSGLVGAAKQLADLPLGSELTNHLLAIELLDGHRDDDAIAFLQSQVSYANSVVQASALKRLLAIDPAIVDRLADGLVASSDVNVRRFCVLAMLETKVEQRIELLAKFLDDVNPGLRTLTAEGLIKLAADEKLRDQVITQVSLVLAEDSWRGCEQASYVLAKLDHKPAGERLVELLSHERGEVKVASAWALTQLRVEKLCPDMLEHAQSVYDGFRSGQLKDAMPGASLQVAHLFIALGDMKYAPADPLMREYLPKSFSLGDHSRPAAAWALGLIHEGNAEEKLVKTLLERLHDIKSLIPEYDSVRQMCAISLGRMNAESTLPDLRLYAGAGPYGVSQSCDWSIEKMTGEPPPTFAPGTLIRDNWILRPIPK